MIESPPEEKKLPKRKGDGGQGRYSYFYELIEPHLEKVEELAKLGFTDLEISKYFGVGYRQFGTYKKQFASLATSLKNGRNKSVEPIVSALFKRANGFVQQVDELVAVRDGNDQVIRHDVKRVAKYFAPDMGALRMWLKYQAPDKFGERVRSIPEDLSLMKVLNKKRKELGWTVTETARAYEEEGIPLPESLKMELQKELKETITAADSAQIKIVLPNIEDPEEAEELIERLK